MSDASGPLRVKVLESNVGEMKVGLSHKATDRADDGHDAAAALGQVSRQRPTERGVRRYRQGRRKR